MYRLDRRKVILRVESYFQVFSLIWKIYTSAFVGLQLVLFQWMIVRFVCKLSVLSTLTPFSVMRDVPRSWMPQIFG